MYLGDSDLAEDYRAQLELLPGVITRDLSQMVNDDGWSLAGWAAKPFAILLSSFREVVFIDADAFFFRNPETLFEDPHYNETGALFFKDRRIMPESKKRWLQQILPQPISKQVQESRLWTGESGHHQESGVLVVDKWKHFVAMLLVTRMNGPDRDGNEEEHKIGVYDMVYGDKETFWIGWELVGDQDYAFHKGDVGIMGKTEALTPLYEESRDDEEDIAAKKGHEREVDVTESAAITSPRLNFTVCAPQLLHLDIGGRPLWFNGGLLSNKFVEKKKKELGIFEVYLREPGENDGDNDSSWRLTDSNICCLTTDHTLSFDDDERVTLRMLAEFAKKAGAYGTGNPR